MEQENTGKMNEIYDIKLMESLFERVGCKNQILDLDKNIYQVQKSLEFKQQPIRMTDSNDLTSEFDCNIKRSQSYDIENNKNFEF